MKAKYLGRMTRDTHPIEYTQWLINSDGEVEAPLDDFMRVEDTESPFHATLGETNTSALAIQIVDEDTYKMWRIW